MNYIDICDKIKKDFKKKNKKINASLDRILRYNEALLLWGYRFIRDGLLTEMEVWLYNNTLPDYTPTKRYQCQCGCVKTMYQQLCLKCRQARPQKKGYATLTNKQFNNLVAVRSLATGEDLMKDIKVLK